MWTDAFIIFMAIYITKFSDKASELLQYMSIIRESESRNKGQGGKFMMRILEYGRHILYNFGLKSTLICGWDSWSHHKAMPLIQI